MSLSGAVLQAVLTAKLRERITGPDAYQVCVQVLECVRHTHPLL